MPQPCKVCASPDRFEIDRLVAEGRPKRAIARQFGLHRGSLDRHSGSHLLADVVRAAERKRLVNAGTCQDIARRILQRALEGVDEARGPDAIAKLVSAATNAARLLGQVTGEVRGDQLVVFFQQRFGVRDEAELGRLVESGRKLERLSEDATADLETLAEEAVSLLEDIMKEKPEWRARIRARLSSGAEVVGETGNRRANSPRSDEGR